MKIYWLYCPYILSYNRTGSLNVKEWAVAAKVKFHFRLEEFMNYKIATPNSAIKIENIYISIYSIQFKFKSIFEAMTRQLFTKNCR